MWQRYSLQGYWTAELLWISVAMITEGMFTSVALMVENGAIIICHNSGGGRELMCGSCAAPAGGERWLSLASAGGGVGGRLAVVASGCVGPEEEKLPSFWK